MRPLNNIQNAIFIVGAVLLVAGALASVLKWVVAPYVFAVGAIAYASMQMLQSYDGRNFVVRRLRRILLFSDVLLLFTALLMFASRQNTLGFDWITYVGYVRNNWVVLLLLAAVLQLYATVRISSELEKEKQG